MADSSWERNPVDKLADEFLERHRRGENPSVTEYAARYPELADEIRDLFPALVMMEELKPAAPEGTATSADGARTEGKKLERLGDFRILREVGRGGMGIVYEAEQESLGRRVALKVLPTQALLDPRQQKRFQREAKAAARLHHTNIVPVFGVGEHDGLHYYVMQFIQGLGLDQVLRELKRLRKTRTATAELALRPPSGGTESGSAGNVAQALLTGKFAAASAPAGGAPEAASRSLQPVTVPYAGHSDTPGSTASSSSLALPGQSDASSLSDTGRHYWQSVARIGIQVAEALEYAHGQGVLHRDIKPSNLLLDNQGTVWVTDFGLAKASADGDDLTHTGDIIGTLRYMAPERFRGQSDAGGDLYSLGLTLYEMLTLRPAFDESDRQRLIHQVTHEEPPRPRKLNRAIPRDLETIVLKATERDPARRYRTPRALAEDLQRFLEDKPIRARQVGHGERLWRWCRRNPALATATGFAAVALMAATVVSVAHAFAVSRYSASLVAEKQQTQQEYERAESARQRAESLSTDLRSSLAASRTLTATMAVEKAQSSIQQHHLHRGLIWLARALELTPAENPSLQQYLRTSLGSVLDEAIMPQSVLKPRGRVFTVAISHDGQFVVTAGMVEREGHVARWDAATGKPVRRLSQPTSGVIALAISPDDKKILGGGYQQAWLWDAATGKQLLPPLTLPGWVYAVAFSPDGKRLLTASGRSVRLWDAATGKAVGPEMVQRSQMYTAAFSPDGETIISGGGLFIGSSINAESDFDLATIGEAQLWDARTGKPSRTLANQPNAVLAASFSPDGKTVVTAGLDRKARFYDAATGRLLGQPIVHPAVISALTFSPDGKAILLAGYGSARLWNVQTRQPIGDSFPQQGYITGVAFDSEGRRLAIPSVQEGVQLWLLRTGRQVGLPLPHASRVQLAAVCPDSKTLVTAGSEVQRWDTTAGAPVGRPLFLPALERPLAFGPGGALLASARARLGAINTSAIYGFGTASVVLHVWDSATGKPVGPALTHEVGVYAAAFSADGKTLATASGPIGTEVIRLWDVTTGKERGPRLPSRNPIFCLAFSPDGKRLVAGTGTASIQVASEGEAEIWDLTRSQRLGGPLLHRGRVIAVAFSPDGRRIATTSEDGTVRLWDGLTGRSLRAPLHHEGPVLAVCFSPDGRFLLSGSEDRTARLWDVETGQPVGTPLSHEGAVATLAFSPDGSFLVTGSQDRTARLWRMPKPLRGTPADIVRRVAAATGTRLDAANVTRALDLGDWNVLVQEAGRERGPERSRVSAAGEWHLRAAVDALEAREWETAIWHLDRYLPLHPDTWLAYALRTRADLELVKPDRAAHDWDEALRRGPRDTVLRWFNWLALQGVERGEKENLTASVWFVERLAAVWPKDWPPHPAWARVYASRAQEHILASRWAEAAADYDRATTFDPDNPQLWEEKGRFHIGREQWLPAADAFHHVLSLVPVERSQHSARSRFCNELAQWPKTLDRLLELRPHDSQLWVSRARYRARLNQWEAAGADYRRADQNRPVSEEFLEQACALLVIGDPAGYRALCNRLADRAGANPDPFTAFVLARTCSAGPGALADPQRAVRWGEQAVASVAVPPGWYVHALGMADWRAGQLDEANQWLSGTFRGRWHPMDTLALAMIHHRLGHPALARRLLNEGLAWMRRQQPALSGQPVSELANDWLEFQALRLEAERLLNAPGRQEAEACLRKHQWAEAIRYLDRLIAADPTAWTDRVLRSCALAESGQHTEAAGEVERATTQAPQAWRPLLMRARFYLDLSRPGKAEADVAAAIRQSAAQRADRGALLGLGAELGSLAQAAQARGRFEPALTWSQQAAEAYRGLCARFADTRGSQDALAEALFSLSRLQRRLRRPAEAMRTAQEIRARWPQNSVHLYNAACEMARCVGLVAQGEPETRRQYTEEALATLRQSVRAGYRDFAHIRQDSDFNAIRAAVDAEHFENRAEEPPP